MICYTRLKKQDVKRVGMESGTMEEPKATRECLIPGADTSLLGNPLAPPEGFDTLNSSWKSDSSADCNASVVAAHPSGYTSAFCCKIAPHPVDAAAQLFRYGAAWLPDPMINNPIFIKVFLKKRLMRCSFHKQRICPFSSVIRLDLSDRKRKRFYQLFQKIKRAVGTVFVIHLAEAKTRAFVYCGILIILFPVRNAVIWHKFHVNLHLLTWIFRTHIWFWLVTFSLRRLFVQLQSPDGAQHRLIAAFVALFTQSVPEHGHIIVVWEMPFDQVIFHLCLLVRTVVRSMGSLLQTSPVSVISRSPPVD